MLNTSMQQALDNAEQRRKIGPTYYRQAGTCKLCLHNAFVTTLEA
jgi:hypothetical protein